MNGIGYKCMGKIIILHLEGLDIHCYMKRGEKLFPNTRYVLDL